jgi:hypothetical protein
MKYLHQWETVPEIGEMLSKKPEWKVDQTFGVKLWTVNP